VARALLHSALYTEKHVEDYFYQAHVDNVALAACGANLIGTE
jgi:hypothetical protein